MRGEKLLLEKGADPYSEEDSCCEYPPLKHVAGHGKVEIVRLRLKQDAASAESKKDHILRALEAACQASHDEVVDVLMDQDPFGCAGNGLQQALSLGYAAELCTAYM
ncbi:uncharacterized protein BP01DRAFT_387431 [Aspergillus saccharolyticus JOP 1030-1]|uniref:Ankyrin n=1 Tax=Aspergillus saccharolyticus JOP 1030-1 TaxID=1450539 RepID=A0A318Z1R2_9EURO|nr:hypothetical protein BP01DRAFT_387431 [Aspergillus saccharolyticus JOP 1030-1]PYH40324.1 hypothetical protein BP01DRAFT_387431 [Aspergillus saccharolyticus JOP 1030-1]